MALLYEIKGFMAYRKGGNAGWFVFCGFFTHLSGEEPQFLKIPYAH